MSSHDTKSYGPQRTTLLNEGETRLALGGISRATLIRFRQRGDLAYVRVGHRVFYLVSDIDDYIARNREGGP